MVADPPPLPASDPHPITPPLPLLVVLLGATGSGKTALALRLAEIFSGEIVSCDSVAVYRDLEIGAAKPSADERARVPHHLLDIASPATTYTAGEYSREARTILQHIAARQRLPIVVGGTGLYLRALLNGLDPAPPRSPALRDRLQQQATTHGSAYLHHLLARLHRSSSAASAAHPPEQDSNQPASAIHPNAAIHPNDTPKLIRALEVHLTAHAAHWPSSMSLAPHTQRQPLQGFRILRIGLDPPRASLYARINQRAAAMFERGLIEETQSLLANYGSDCWPLSALGYKQAASYLREEITRQAAITATQQGHRNYAKRQATWFRREPDVHWLPGFGEDASTEASAIALIAKASR